MQNNRESYFQEVVKKYTRVLEAEKTEKIDKNEYVFHLKTVDIIIRLHHEISERLIKKTQINDACFYSIKSIYSRIYALWLKQDEMENYMSLEVNGDSDTRYMNYAITPGVVFKDITKIKKSFKEEVESLPENRLLVETGIVQFRNQ